MIFRSIYVEGRRLKGEEIMVYPGSGGSSGEIEAIAPPPCSQKKVYFWLGCLNFWELSPFIYNYGIPPPLPFFGGCIRPCILREMCHERG